MPEYKKIFDSCLVLHLYLKQNDNDAMIFRLESGDLKSELIEYVSKCQLIVRQDEGSSLEIVPFPTKPFSFPKEISHSVTDDSSLGPQSAIPNSERQVNGEPEKSQTKSKTEIYNFFASCQCEKPQQTAISLTSNDLDVIQGISIV